MGCFVFFLITLRATVIYVIALFFFLFLPDNKFLFHWIISWRVADLPWTQKKKKKKNALILQWRLEKSCSRSLIPAWKCYTESNTKQNSFHVLFSSMKPDFCADLFYVDVKLICCLFSLHIIHNDNHPMNISFTWVITNLGNCVQRQPRSLLHAVIWTCLNIQNTKSTHPWTKSWLNGLTIMHNEELLITYSE